MTSNDYAAIGKRVPTSSSEVFQTGVASAFSGRGENFTRGINYRKFLETGAEE